MKRRDRARCSGDRSNLRRRYVAGLVYEANVCHRGIDDPIDLQGQARRRRVWTGCVEDSNGAAIDWHFPYVRVVLPKEIDAVRDQIAVTVDNVDVGYGRQHCGRSS